MDQFFRGFIKNFFLVISYCAFSYGSFYSQTLSINEFSNGPSGTKEYIEFIVIDTGATYDCVNLTIPCVDIRGWIIDDNNGYHGSNGVAGGCNRFSNDVFWSCIPVGTIITIYNGTDANPALPPDDISMTDGNCRLVIPIENTTLFDNNTSTPGAIACDYPLTGWNPGGVWFRIGMRNGGDCVRIVDLAGCEVFSLSYGDVNLNSTIYFPGSGTDDVFFFNGGDPSIQTNWSQGCAGDIASCGSDDQTPGLSNSSLNEDYISQFNHNCEPLTILSTVASNIANASCICDGNATIEASGSIPTYSYEWTDINFISIGQNSATASNLCQGVYHCIVESSIGCLDTIQVTIDQNSSLITPSFTPIEEICSGELFILPSNSNNGITGTWSPIINNTSTTNYTFTPDAGQCAIDTTLTVIVNQNSIGTDTQNACDSYTWIDGVTYTSSNSSATILLTASGGCDSLVTLDLTIGNSNTGTDTQTACDSYTWVDGNTYTVSNNSATWILTNAAGCDSTVTLDLTITNSNSGTDTQTACGLFTWIDGNTYTASNNSATWILTNASGCDSTVTLDLTITNSNTGTDTQIACGSYTWIDGITYTASNNSATFNILGGAANGCDSLVTLDLTISNAVNGIDTQIACDSYTWIDGNTYTTSNNTATFTIFGGSSSGCDSTVTLDLTINNSNSTVLSETFDSATITGANGPVLYGNGGSDFNASYALSGTFFGWFNVQNGIGDVDIYDINVPGLNPGCTVTASIWMRMSYNAPNVSISLIDDNGIIMDSTNLTLTTSWQQITLTAPVSTNGINYIVHYNSTGGNGLDVIMEDLLITQSCGINAEISQVTDQCFDGNNFIFDGGGSTGSGGISSYTWDYGDATTNGNSVTTNHSYSSAGNYDLNLTVSDGICTDDTTININVIQNPIATSPADVIECNAYILPALSNGNYFSLSNGQGSSYSSGAYFSTNQTLFVYAESGTTPNCIDENSFTITINNSVSGTDTQSSCGSYTWIDGNTYTASNNSATYNIPGGSANGCDSLVTLNLTINNAINSTDIQSACETFTWIDGNTYTSSNNTATFTILGGSASGCDSIVTLNLTIFNNVSSTDTQIACDSYTWIDGITYTSDNNTATFLLSTSSGCDSIVTLDLTINVLTGLVAGSDIFECAGNEATLSASGANTYSWNNGIPNGSLIIVNEGITTYTVIGQDINGCSAEQQVTITGWVNPSISSLPTNPLCIGDNSGSVEIEINSGTPPFSINWSNGDSSTLIQNLYADTYEVTVIDDNGCETSNSIVLADPFEPCYEEPEINIYIPNSFSPDNNEHNQTWFIVAEGISVQHFNLMIFNRWGQLIWESNDIRVGWDGTYKNKNVPDGTYTYKIEYQSSNGEQKESITGHLNLLR